MIGSASDYNISGSGSGELLLTIEINDSSPAFSGSYNYDLQDISIPPITTPWKVTGAKTGYSYDLPGIHMPDKPNNFTVAVQEVKNLNIGLKKLQGSYERIWITTQVVANEKGLATTTSDLLSPGIYHVKIFGDAAENATQVNLTMTLVKKIIVSGPFNLSLNTTGFPEGDYSVTMKAINGSFQLDEIAMEDLSL
ncbi:MAG: hypothetical protein NTY37_09020 [Methanothrix sp.]|nr:hypothetical protein [Methanothrix sp.]